MLTSCPPGSAITWSGWAGPTSTPWRGGTGRCASARPGARPRGPSPAPGMALQADIIPATGTDYFTTNIEDGLALADLSLRDAFAASYPAAWERIQARRRFMRG